MVEEHTEGILHSLRIVAASAQARSGKEGEYKPLLMRLSQDISTDATAWFVYPDGRYFATEEAGMTDQNLKDRPYFPTLMGGKETFGDLVISKSTGHRSVIIAVPVSVDGKVIGAVGVSLRVRLLSELVDKHMALPATSYFYALERDTRIVLHRKAERMFQTPSDVGDEALGEEFKKVLKQDHGTFEYTLQGKKIASIYEFSPDLGWYFFIAKEVGAQ
jgi:methyl-accepting chemotaxis protein